MASLKQLLRRRNGPRVQADWIIAGLGNPGRDYADTRHNVGFRVVNLLAKRAGVKPVRLGATMSAATGDLSGHSVLLMKPLTMMNLSGKAVAAALRRTGATLEHTIVVYDDLDMQTGAIRIRAGGGHGGHNGLKSIRAEAGGLEFTRVKLGIGRPNGADGQPTWESDYVRDWVLSPPEGHDRDILAETVTRAADAVETILIEGADLAASRFNRRSG